MVIFGQAFALLPPQPVSSSRKAAEHLLQIYQNHRSTFFCNQPFFSQGTIDFQSCPHCPLVRTQIQWIPLVSIQRMAQHLLCYQEKICMNRKGQRFKGLRCCQERDDYFRHMVLDLHNLVPELPSFKALRRQYHFGILKEPIESTGECHFYIDQKAKLIEPSPMVRGMIARTYLYMRDTYYLPLSAEESALYLGWHQRYPVTAWERERNQQIKLIQGNSNYYIL